MSEPVLTDLPLVRRAAISANAPQHLGSLLLENVSGLAVLQVLAKPGDAPPKAPEGFNLRSAGPGQWFATGPLGESEAAILAFAPSAFLVDQSHGHVLIRVSGEPVRKMLAKGTAIDLNPAQFAIGVAVPTLFGHISVNICRTGGEVFELLVLRSFADSLWNELETMSAEFA